MEKIIVISLFGVFALTIGVMYLIPAMKCLISRETVVRENLTVNTTDTLKGIMILGIMFSHIVLKASHFQQEWECGIAVKVMLTFMGYLGSIGVAVFFILSGYGNSASIEKCKSTRQLAGWFLRRIRKLIQIYILCFAMSICMGSVMFGQKYSFDEMVVGLVTLTIPQTTTWYLKIQLLLYVFTFIAVFFWKQNKNAVVLLVVSLSIIYIVIAKYLLDLDKYWWNTIICYSIGQYIYILKK